ncbi:MAG: DUF167 domain-containing protein [Candidatus Thermoplasmatota archaeon]
MDYSHAVQQTPRSVLLKLHIIPGSNKVCFPAGYNTWRKCIEVRLVSNPQDNQANKELLRIIASFFAIPLQDLSIVSGKKSREKIVELRNSTKENVIARLGDELNEL